MQSIRRDIFIRRLIDIKNNNAYIWKENENYI